LFIQLCAKQFQCAAGFEGFGDGLAEVGDGDADGSFLEDVRYLVAVGRDDHGVQVPSLVYLMTVSTKGELAAAAEGVEDGALGGDSVLGGRAVKDADGGVDGGVREFSG
jgi:hypothetical protein